METEELLQLSIDTISIVQDLEKDALEGLEGIPSEWFDFLYVGATQFDTLDSVITLLEKGTHKDCFALLRSVFEGYFFLLLMMYGKKYRETRRIRIIPETSKDPKAARDQTLEKWESARKSGDLRYEKIIGLNKEGDDIILVTIEDEGLYQTGNAERKGPIVTRYYFAFDEYDPETRFIAKLPSVSAADPYPDVTNERWKQQKIIYHNYFYTSNIEENLKLNGLLDDEQQDRFQVHYNFLSMFVHPTKPGTPRESNKRFAYPYTPRVMGPAREELILLYVCKFQSLLLQSLAKFFEGANPKSNLGKYRAQVQRLEDATKDFWFIYDDPTSFDKSRSKYLKEVATDLGYTVDPDKILYYRNPLKRLADLRICQGKLQPYA